MLGLEKRIKAMYGTDVDGFDEDSKVRKLPPREQRIEAVRDTSVLSLGLAVLAILLSIGFFLGTDYKLNQARSDLSTRFDAVSGVQNDVRTLGTQVGYLDQRVAGLESMPMQARKLILSTYVEDMAQRASMLGGQLDNPEHKARLSQIQDLLKQIQSEMK